jgi:dihydroorotase
MLIIDMELKIELYSSQAYECTRCKTFECCSSYTPGLYFSDIRKIWEKREELGIEKVTDFVESQGRLFYYLKREGEIGSSCIFYEEGDKRGCVLHRKFGKNYKPIICQVFPHELKISEEDGEIKVWRRPKNPCPADSQPIAEKLDEILEICKSFFKQYQEHVKLLEIFEFKDGLENLQEIINYQFEREKENISIEFAESPWIPAKSVI